MKKNISIFLALIIFSTFNILNAQDMAQSIGIELIPGFNLPIVKDKLEFNSDSNSISYHSRLSLGGGINYTWEPNQNIKFQLGLSYTDNGHRYTVHDLGFLDTIHKSIGRKNDLSQTGDEQNVYSNVRYQYIEIPITAHFRLNPRPKIPGLYFFISTGVAPSFQIKHNEVVRLRGFTALEKNKFFVDNTNYESNKINLGFLLGARVEYKIDKQFSVSIDPRLKGYIMAGNKDTEKHGLVNIQSAVTLNYLF